MIRALKYIYSFIYSIMKERKLIMDLAKNDFKVRYAGSYLGAIWAFINPVVTILVFWFVFEVGFRSKPVKDFPYILWLVTGLIPWFFFSDSISNGMNSLIEYSYLVKKVVFRVSILPIVKILSSLFVHLFFVTFIFIMFGLYGYGIHIINIQILYYLTCMVFLVLGLSFINASVIPFFKDTGQIIGVILQFGFWLTPIFWSYENLPVKYRFMLNLNPAFYITNGYRDTFINHVWFWEKPGPGLYFWIISTFIFLLGIFMFKKLRPHFSDVL